jgi:hypothetical protein
MKNNFFDSGFRAGSKKEENIFPFSIQEEFIR